MNKYLLIFMLILLEGCAARFPGWEKVAILESVDGKPCVKKEVEACQYEYSNIVCQKWLKKRATLVKANAVVIKEKVGTLFSCKNGNPIYHTVTKPAVDLKPISIPNLNEVTTAYLGDSLLWQFFGIHGNSIRLRSTPDGYLKHKLGTYCQIDKDSNYFVQIRREAVDSIRTRTAIYLDYLYYNKKDKNICISYPENTCYHSYEASILENQNGICLEPNEFQKKIEYNGKNGNILNFTYREFMADVIRGSYTTNFFMDLSEGNTLTYKGAKIKIVSATNNEITYIILKNFDQIIR